MKYLIVLFLLFSTTVLFADEVKKINANQKKNSYLIENWYFFFGLGSGYLTTNNENLNEHLDSFYNKDFEENNANMELMVYHSYNLNVLFGGGMSIFGNIYEGPEGEQVDLSNFMFVLSGIYFFDVINNGFFVRIDAGKGVSALNYELIDYNKSSTEKINNINFGIGYAFRTTKEASFDIYVLNQNLYNDKISIVTLTLNAAILW